MDDVPLKNQQRNPDEVLPTFPYFPGPQSTSQHQVAAGISGSYNLGIADVCVAEAPQVEWTGTVTQTMPKPKEGGLYSI